MGAVFSTFWNHYGLSRTQLHAAISQVDRQLSFDDIKIRPRCHAYASDIRLPRPLAAPPNYLRCKASGCTSGVDMHQKGSSHQ